MATPPSWVITPAAAVTRNPPAGRVRRGAPPGRSCTNALGSVGELVEREHDDVARHPRLHGAAVGDPERVGDAAGELVDARLDGQIAAVAHVLGEQQGRVARAAHHLEMRPGVAGADHGGRVGDERRHLARVVVRQRLGDHARGEVVLEHPVGQHVRRVPAARRDHVGQRGAEELFLAVAHRREPHPVDA